MQYLYNNIRNRLFFFFFFFLRIRRPARSTPLYSSAASDVYKRQVLIIISSCKPTKDITRSTNLDTERLNAKQVIRKVSKSKSKFRSFQSKLKIKLNNKGKNKSYSANIRIIKDKAIWLSSCLLYTSDAADE